MPRLLSLGLLLLAACSSPDHATSLAGDADGTHQGQDAQVELGEPLDPAAPPVWKEVGQVSFDSRGHSPPLELPSSPGCRGRLLRLVDPAGLPPRGFEALLPSGIVDGGAGYGLFVLPGSSLTLSLQLTDPRFGGPLLDASLFDAPTTASLLCAPEPPPEAPLRLELRVGVPGGVLSGEVLTSPGWVSLIEEARRQLAVAGIRLVVTRAIHLPEVAPEELEVTPGVLEASGVLGPDSLGALGSQEESFVPLLLVRRLGFREDGGFRGADLAAFSTRIPGGYSPGVVSAVLLATEDREGSLWNPGRGRWLGMILAHEIGHYLGLPHDEVVHTGAPSPSTLMSSQIAHLAPEGVSLSEEQARALRQHPLITFPEVSP